MAIPGEPSANSDFPWNRFAPDWYYDHNYQVLRDDDRQIIEQVRDFFAGAGVSGGAGIDIGAGANLYPSFAMLPFCRRVDVWEFSEPNVAWLTAQAEKYDVNWDQFWDVYRESPAYARVRDPRESLARKGQVRQASVFDLPRNSWDMGTMFFVACSLSTELAEFHRAVSCFVGALKPDAPFAAAFMKKSEGYEVDGLRFPAVKISSEDVTQSLASIAYAVQISEIVTDNPLRPGYEGMLLALGRRVG